MQDDGLYTVTWPLNPGAAAASLVAAGVTLAAATEINWLIIEPSDLLEVGVNVNNAAGTGANTFAFTVTKAQTTAAASDLATALAVITGPTAAAVTQGTVLRGYKDAYPLLAAEVPPVGTGHPTSRPSNTIAYTPSTLGVSSSTAHDLWHFERGDVLVFTVSDVSAAGGLGTFYARFQRTGSPRTNRKRLVATGNAVVVDVDSTT